MSLTGLVYHEDYLLHKPYKGIPDVPERVSKTIEYFKETGLMDLLMVLTPEPATREDLLRVHTEEHVNYVRDISVRGYEENAVIDPAIFIGPDTYHGATLAAGGTMMGAESVYKGDVDNCFCLVRPPGHHASHSFPAGYCYFNNIAVAIRYMQDKYKLQRFAIFDWDSHASNGTMNIFYNDPNVLTISIHQDPKDSYPGTGTLEQIGSEEGKGYCLNIPVPSGSGDVDYMYILDEFVLNKIKYHKPDMIFVSAGQDSHVNDLTSNIKLTDDGYVAMTKRLMDLSRKVCDNRLVINLEGGYHLDTLPITHHAIVSTLLGLREAPEIEGEPNEVIEDELLKLKDYLFSIAFKEKELEEGDEKGKKKDWKGMNY